MPMVWVDFDCDGECSSAKEAERLQAIIDEAEIHLRNGDVNAALHALTGDTSLGLRHPADIAEKYRRWQSCALPGFANFRRDA